MPAFHKLAVRDGTSEGLSTNQLLTIIAVLIIFGLVAKVLVFVFVILPRLRRRREERARMNGFGSNYKQLSVDTSSSPHYVVQEKLRLMEDSSAPSSPSAVPEIRITFPDEVDKSGRPQSGGVVVVRMGENNALGLEPVHEQLPAYSKEGSGFINMDLEKMGGLREAPQYR
jgi:hypothetical protein